MRGKTVTRKLTKATLLYANEHLSCLNYDNSNNARINKRILTVGEQWETTPAVNHIIVVFKGGIRFSFGYYINQQCSEGDFFFLPATHHIYIRAEKDTEIILFRLYNKIQFCDQYRIDTLRQQTAADSKTSIQRGDTPCLLKMNDILLNYFNLLNRCYEEGLRCKYYFEAKIAELFYILRAFYRKEDLANFFSEALSTDINFSDFVVCNYNKYSLDKLAAAMNYSESGFYRHFRQVFGMPPYKWITEQKAKEVYHRICTENKNFKELSYELGFSSLSHFYRFIQDNFKQTPGDIRKIHKIAGNSE
jgi:AraC-like DNA-binding protein